MIVVTNLAAWHCIIPILFMSPAVYGSHTELAYSSLGMTNDLYACSFTFDELMLRFLLRKFSVLLALLHMLFM